MLCSDMCREIHSSVIDVYIHRYVDFLIFIVVVVVVVSAKINDMYIQVES